MELVDTLNWFAGKTYNDVARHKARSLCRTIVIHRNDQNAVIVWQIVITSYLSPNGHILSRDPNIASANPAVADQSAGNELSRVDRYRKTQPLCGGDHCRIDADDLATGIYQRSA